MAFFAWFDAKTPYRLSLAMQQTFCCSPSIFIRAIRPNEGHELHLVFRLKFISCTSFAELGRFRPNEVHFMYWICTNLPNTRVFCKMKYVFCPSLPLGCPIHPIVVHQMKFIPRQMHLANHVRMPFGPSAQHVLHEIHVPDGPQAVRHIRPCPLRPTQSEV
jgi:hypothetical protein